MQYYYGTTLAVLSGMSGNVNQSFKLYVQWPNQHTSMLQNHILPSYTVNSDWSSNIVI